MISCSAAAVLDILASALATAATAPREGACEGAFFFCSFQDLLPLAVIRVALLVLTTLITYFITRKPSAAVEVSNHLLIFKMICAIFHGLRQYSSINASSAGGGGGGGGGD